MEDVLNKIKQDHISNTESVTFVYETGHKRVLEHHSEWFEQNKNWKHKSRAEIYGSEDAVIVIFGFFPAPEQLSRAKNALIFVTSKG